MPNFYIKKMFIDKNFFIFQEKIKILISNREGKTQKNVRKIINIAIILNSANSM